MLTKPEFWQKIQANTQDSACVAFSDLCDGINCDECPYIVD